MSDDYSHQHPNYDFSVLDKYAVMLDPESAPPYGKDRILTRYSKKLLKEGEQYYGTIRIPIGGTKRRYASIDDPWDGHEEPKTDL